MKQISRIGSSLARIDTVSNELRLFGAQQRAIGELMVHPDGEPSRRRCRGYAEFCSKLEQDQEFAAWFSDPLDPRRKRFPQFRPAYSPRGRPRS
ncbi:hypothetical protein [Streptomyces sp. SID2563]|uniref:hypothetical protein n=1 Tax=Streptomyces sp. SID2563 TaxID=2690255 RepID=UPI001F26AFD5|nr:hypothetical protein [Streptomyces sp. SID2563]